MLTPLVTAATLEVEAMKEIKSQRMVGACGFASDFV